MNLCSSFLQFPHVTLCSHSPVRDSITPLYHYRITGTCFAFLIHTPFASYIDDAVYFRKSVFFPVDGGSSCLRNVALLWPNCVTSHPRGHYSLAMWDAEAWRHVWMRERSLLRAVSRGGRGESVGTVSGLWNGIGVRFPAGEKFFCPPKR